MQLIFESLIWCFKNWPRNSVLYKTAVQFILPSPSQARTKLQLFSMKIPTKSPRATPILRKNCPARRLWLCACEKVIDSPLQSCTQHLSGLVRAISVNTSGRTHRVGSFIAEYIYKLQNFSKRIIFSR